MSQVEVIISIDLPDKDRTPANLTSLADHKQYCMDVANSLVNDLAQRGELHTSFKKVTITDNYETAVQEQADIWDVGKYYHTKGRGFIGVGRVVYNENASRPERYVFIPTHMSTERFFPVVLYGLMLEVHATSLLPERLQTIRLTHLPWTFHSHVEVALPNWIKTYWTRSRIAERFEKELCVHRLPDDCYAAFARDLKRLLFEYNSYVGDGDANNTQRIGLFWDKLFLSTEFMINGLLEAAPYSDQVILSTNTEVTHLLNEIVTKVKRLTDSVHQQQTYSIDKLKTLLLTLYRQHGVNITEHNPGIEVRLVKNPKSYMKGEIVDTEPRFVCFIDILGFSAMVEEYDSDSSSNILQKLQAAFQEAMQTLTTQYRGSEDSDIDYLEYRVFSDCICISLPYFDNEVNYATNLLLLLTYVRGLQTALMVRGVFTRGGIAAGPYYMDQNILFSKAMIRAYKIESKEATHPRVVIDGTIIEKLRTYPATSLHVQSVMSVLVQDTDNVVFLNPFNSLTNSVEQFKRSIVDAKTSLFSKDNENDELTKLMTGFANNVMDWSMSLVENSLDDNADEALHQLIREAIRQERQKLEMQKSNSIDDPQALKGAEKALAKYDWLEKFINWATSPVCTEAEFRNFLHTSLMES